MWKKINSPIVITIIVLLAVLVSKATRKPKLASEIRGAYEELSAIVEDGASDAEKSKAIQEFVQEIATQLRQGFSEGFGKDSEDKMYVATKDKVNILGIKFIKAKYPSRERFMFVVKNTSDKNISSLRLNYEFYKKGELIDCENTWVSQIKLLEPNQEIAISGERSLPKEATDNDKSDEVRIKITSFNLKQTE